MTENLCRQLADAMLADRPWARECDHAELARALQTAGAQWLQMIEKLEARRTHVDADEAWYSTFKAKMTEQRLTRVARDER